MFEILSTDKSYIVYCVISSRQFHMCTNLSLEGAEDTHSHIKQQELGPALVWLMESPWTHHWIF